MSWRQCVLGCFSFPVWALHDGKYSVLGICILPVFALTASRKIPFHPSACHIRFSMFRVFDWSSLSCFWFLEGLTPIIGQKSTVSFPWVLDHPLVSNLLTWTFDYFCFFSFYWLSLSAAHRHGVTATPIASVVQKSDRSEGIAYVTRSSWLASLNPPGDVPKTTHLRGEFLATRFPACLFSPVCMWAGSIPIKRSTGPLPRWMFSFLRSRTPVISLVFMSTTLSLMRGIAFTENVFLLSNEVTWNLNTFVFSFSSSPPIFVIS